MLPTFQFIVVRRNAMSARERLLEMVDEGILDPIKAIEMCVLWMSDSEVEEMMDVNELSERFFEDYE